MEKLSLNEIKHFVHYPQWIVKISVPVANITIYVVV